MDEKKYLSRLPKNKNNKFLGDIIGFSLILIITMMMFCIGYSLLNLAINIQF
jgi:hypothetical protein